MKVTVKQATKALGEYTQERIQEIFQFGVLTPSEVSKLPISPDARVRLLLHPTVLGIRGFVRALRSMAARADNLYDFRMRWVEAILYPARETWWLARASAAPRESIIIATAQERARQLQDIVEVLQ